MPESVLPDWPRFLSRNGAATYLGVGVTTFDAEVRAGLWPKPMRRGSRDGRLTWDRALLDRAADRLAGISGGALPDQGFRAAEQAALEAASNVTTAPVRHQHHHSHTSGRDQAG